MLLDVAIIVVTLVVFFVVGSIFVGEPVMSVLSLIVTIAICGWFGYDIYKKSEAVDDARNERIHASIVKNGLDGREMQLIIGDNIKEVTEINGHFGGIFLFCGSISSDTQEFLRIGITDKESVSRIVKVPIESIEFLQNGKNPSATIKIDKRYYEPGANLQDNLNNCLKIIRINISPENFQKLIAG